ncbi:MAG: sterol desaturase family protein [Myxococcota bacterium]
MPDGALATPHAAQGSVEAEPAAARPRPFSRDRVIDRSFSLFSHLSRTMGIAAAIAGLGTWLAWGAPWWAWLAVPVFWLVANAFEYATHRYPMHRPLRPRVLYTNHACIHHRAFAGHDQEIDELCELSVVMMPWYTLLFVFAGASPLVVVAGLVGGVGLSGVFLISAVSYFLFYEVIHTLHHLPLSVLRRSWWGRRPQLARMRAHHHHHHQLERMTRVNFNVTFAITDRLMGTYELPGETSQP